MVLIIHLLACGDFACDAGCMRGGLFYAIVGVDRDELVCLNGSGGSQFLRLGQIAFKVF